MSVDAIVLRRTEYRDHDLIVELLTPESGSVSAIARGARKSQKRFAGGLEVGSRLKVEVTQRGKGLATLKGCTLVSPLKTVRYDLERFHHLSYALELVRALSSPGRSDPVCYAMLVHFMGVLDAEPPTLDGLAAWELRMLAHQGLSLSFWPCVRTQKQPDAISLSQGGAVARSLVATPDAIPLPTRVLFNLHQLVTGASVEEWVLGERSVRGFLDELWPQVIGRRLKSSRFLVPMDPMSMLSTYLPAGHPSDLSGGDQ